MPKYVDLWKGDYGQILPKKYPRRSHTMDLWLSLLIKGHVFNSNSDANEQSEEISEDDG